MDLDERRDAIKVDLAERIMNTIPQIPDDISNLSAEDLEKLFNVIDARAERVLELLGDGKKTVVGRRPRTARRSERFHTPQLDADIRRPSRRSSSDSEGGFRLDDEKSSPRGKGNYFSNPDYTSLLFKDKNGDGLSLAALSQQLLDEMIVFEAQKLNMAPRSRDEARNMADYHNHPDVVDDWEKSVQHDDDYEGPEWFYGALASFVFSIKSLYGTQKFLREKQDNWKPGVVLDWGGGLGMHAVASSYMWKEAKAYMYNLPGLQTDFAKEWVKPNYKPNSMIVKSKRESLPEAADLILCYEVLEHIKEPLPMVDDIMSFGAEYLSISFSFTAPCHGHFSEYTVDGEEYSRTEITRLVNDRFREKYSPVGHGWNSRPVLWKRNE